MNIIELKNKLRQLKKLEAVLRTGYRTRGLVWDSFFCTKPVVKTGVRYNFEDLLQMDKAAFKSAVDEYLLQMYCQMYKEQGEPLDGVYDPLLLKMLGLPSYATRTEIRKRFRELAKQYHPDCGGEHEKMLELLDVYNLIMEEV